MKKHYILRVINDVLRLIERITYSTGRVTEKIINPVTGMPIEFCDEV